MKIMANGLSWQAVLVASWFGRGLMGACVALVLSSAGWGNAMAAYPTRALTLVVPSPPGGSTDAVARVLGEALSKRLGQPVVIENKAGGGGIVGTSYVLDKPADGYTMLLAISSKTVINALQPTLSYNAIKDMVSIALISRVPTVMVTSLESGLADFAQLKAYIASRPGEAVWGVPGIGTAPHLTEHVLTSSLQVKVNEVQYRGSAPMHVDLLAGRVDIVVDSFTALGSHIASNKVVPVAVVGQSRIDAIGSVPTLGELGIDAFNEVLFDGWNAIDVRADTDPDIIERLNREIRAVLGDPAFQKRANELGLVPFKPMSASASQAFVDNTSSKLAPVAASLAAGQQ